VVGSIVYHSKLVETLATNVYIYGLFHQIQQSTHNIQKHREELSTLTSLLSNHIAQFTSMYH